LGNNLKDIVYWKNVNMREEFQRLIEEDVAKIRHMTGISLGVSGIPGVTRLP
jgi:hypothetical protein